MTLSMRPILWILLLIGLAACKPSDRPIADSDSQDSKAADTKTGEPSSEKPAQDSKPAAGSQETPPAEKKTPAEDEGREPDAIKVQHILIGFRDAVGFRGSAPKGAAQRTQAQAQALAEDLLNRARAGESFGTLVAEYTDDSAPGIYGMTNRGAPSRPGYSRRDGMVGAFGDVGFKLKLGEIGMSVYDTRTSPYGWHIIKRVE